MKKKKAIQQAEQQQTTPSINLTQKHYIWLIIIVAIVARFVYITQIRDMPFFSTPVGDEKAYHLSALNILKGDILAGKGIFYQDPFYPYYLAVVYNFFGQKVIMPKAIQFIFGIASCFLIFLITRRLFGFEYAVLAGLVSSIYPLFYFFEAQLLKSSLVVFFTLSSFFLLLLYKDNRDKNLLIFSGLFMGLGVIAQGHSYFFIPFILYWIYSLEKGMPIKKVIKLLSYFVAAVIIVIAPITIRNLIVGKDFVLTTYQGGTNFFMGNNEKASGIYQPIKGGRELPPYEEIDAVEAAQQESGRKLKPSQVSSFWFRKGLKFIFSSPIQYIKLLFKKILIYINVLEPPDVVDYYFVKQRSFLFRIPLLNFGFVFPLALIGVFLSWKEKSQERILLYYFMLASFLSVVLFYIFSRYRLQGVPFFIIMASYTVIKLREYIKTKQLNKIFVLSPILLVLIIISNIDLDITKPGLGNDLMGNLLMQKKDYAKALENFKIAAKGNPNDLQVQTNLNLNMARCYFELGDYENALASYQKVLQIQNLRTTITEPEVLYTINANIGLIYYRKRDYAKSRAVYENLKNMYPLNIEVRTQLGNIYKKMNLLDLAVEEYNYVVSKDTMNIVACNNIGNIYRDTGKYDLAGKFYKMCLQMDPQNSIVMRNIQRMEQMRTGTKEPDSDDLD